MSQNLVTLFIHIHFTGAVIYTGIVHEFEQRLKMVVNIPDRKTRNYLFGFGVLRHGGHFLAVKKNVRYLLALSNDWMTRKTQWINKDIVWYHWMLESSGIENIPRVRLTQRTYKIIKKGGFKCAKIHRYAATISGKKRL